MNRSRAWLTRREVLKLAGAVVVGLALRPASTARAASPAAGGPDSAEALRRLLEGNARFVKGEPANPCRRPEGFRLLADGQTPMAVIVGCSDSRVAPELLFDQGVGDLFVVRVAGNVMSGAGAPVKGSIEYAVAELRVPLVMVLGHGECSAVKAAIKQVEARDVLPGALGSLVNSIRPAVLKAKGHQGNRLDNAIRANVELGHCRCGHVRHYALA